uniref:Uncharacterized protein n=1 Tax=Marseillevirus LCMAC101 TaxID=2506602 RepID=A0A481YTD7_9VIRU|nr:MAG: hypothetical protein LCMAC101_07720 [Marseillevirus LCMAC101]
MEVERISNILLKDIKKERSFGEKIIQEQKKTWLKFSTPVPSNLHKPITKKLKQEGEIIKWLSDDEIEIKLC